MLRFSKYKNEPSKKPFTDILMHLIQAHQGTEFLSDNPQTDTFIIAQNKEGSICGGAFLQSSKIEHLQAKVGNIFPRSAVDAKEVWTCIVCLAPEENEHLMTREYYDMAHSFYRKLYAMLLKFGEENNIGFLYLIMEKKQYLNTIKTGLWPYIAALNQPFGGSHGFSCGILSLRGPQVDLYKNTLEGYDCLVKGPSLTAEEFEKIERGEARLTRTIRGV